MPNAIDYRDAAARFRLLRDALGRQSAQVSQWMAREQLVRGPVAAAVDSSMTVTSRHLSAAAEKLARLALVCDTRASVCDDYRRRLEAWADLNPLERLFADRPEPPLPWVSA